MEAFTRAVALDLSPFGIRVNAVGAGAIHTEKHRARGPEFEIHRAQPVPLGRVGVSADVAGAVVFLASNDAEYITGQTIYVDGDVCAVAAPPDGQAPPRIGDWFVGSMAKEQKLIRRKRPHM